MAGVLRHQRLKGWERAERLLRRDRAKGQSQKVVCCGQTHEVWTKRFWIVPTPACSFIFHNATRSEGLVASASSFNYVRGIGRLGSPFALRPISNEQERIWEQVRRARAHAVPSRSDSIFLYDDTRVIRYVLDHWCRGEARHVIEARVVKGSRLHKADMRWLDSVEHEWTELARSYWSGEMTLSPLAEILVDGAIYIPRWREPPFGIGAGLPNKPRVTSP